MAATLFLTTTQGVCQGLIAGQNHRIRCVCVFVQEQPFNRLLSLRISFSSFNLLLLLTSNLKAQQHIYFPLLCGDNNWSALFFSPFRTFSYYRFYLLHHFNQFVESCFIEKSPFSIANLPPSSRTHLAHSQVIWDFCFFTFSQGHLWTCLLFITSVHRHVCLPACLSVRPSVCSLVVFFKFLIAFVYLPTIVFDLTFRFATIEIKIRICLPTMLCSLNSEFRPRL